METLTKVTVPTVVLRDLVSRAVKGSTNVDLIPMSGLMKVKQQDGKLYVSTTDNTNYLTTFADVVADNFEFIVQSKIFSQVVSKLTSVDTTFIIEGNKITIEANGKYSISSVTDADGSNIAFPSVEVSSTGSAIHLKPEEVKSILSLSKSCKGEKNEIPAVIGNYYLDADRVLTTNYYKACSNPIKVTETPVLVNSFVMDLVNAVVDESGVDTYQDADYIVFESTKGRLVGKKNNSDIADYPASDLINLISNDLASSVQINRTQFVQAVDRMCLFVDTYEQNRLSLNFTNDGLILYSTKTDSSELIKYISSSPIENEVKFSVDGFFLKAELTACDKEDLTVRFSDDVGLQIKCGETTLMLGLLNESEE